MSWYLRSIADDDTHCGELKQDGMVKAECGAEFRPHLVAFGRTALPGYPPDPDQVCPACRAKIPDQGRQDQILTRLEPTPCSPVGRRSERPSASQLSAADRPFHAAGPASGPAQRP